MSIENIYPMIGPEINDDGTLNTDNLTRGERFVYGQGHRDCVELVREFLVDEKDDLETYKEFINKYNAYVVYREQFGL